MLDQSLTAVWGSAVNVPRLSVHLSKSEDFLPDSFFSTKTKNNNKFSFLCHLKYTTLKLIV